jgi:hypothetical protein
MERIVIAPTMVVKVVFLLALVLVFQPLLVGVLRAAWLAVHPRLSKEERRARRAMQDAQLVRKLINRNIGPSDAAELRALAARG